MIRHFLRIGIVASLCVGAVPDMASAQRGSSFDGSWSVVIVTTRGNCDRAYRYGVTIRSGVVYYGGSPSGRVSPSGAVSVSVSAGGASASGSGRLRGNSGGGSWRGQSNGERCSGSWSASRGG
jgi:hypothetical protein